jgi:predicted O-methyltransferase YrrM
MHSLLGDDKLKVIERLCAQIYPLDGAAAEVGVYRGGSAVKIANWLPHKTIHLFDTFKGIPFKGPNDWHEVGDFGNTSLERVQKALKDVTNVKYHAGLFPADYKGDDNFSLVHLDADQYQVTKDALEFFYPRLVYGGCIVLDDYGWKNCPGIQRAVWDFLEYRDEELIQEVTYQAYFFKRTIKCH